MFNKIYDWLKNFIRNNLKGYNLDIIDRVLKNNKLDLTSRAEQLPIEVFVEISNKLS